MNEKTTLKLEFPSNQTDNSTAESRLHNLDYLRGIAATGIYHYFSWNFGAFDSHSVLGRVGIYGVSIFYVLSGLTLFHVYHKKMKPDYMDIRDFFIKRIFRIFPLLWLATISAIILTRDVPNFGKLFMNLTGLFGLIAWDQYYATGAWSIGNELVFYLFFPMFIFLFHKFRILMWMFFGLLCMLYFVFANYFIDPSLPLSEQWHIYINPLNQVPLLAGGFLIGVFFNQKIISNKIGLLLLISGILIFSLYPVGGEAVNMVSGSPRIILSLSCLLICIAFYKLRFTLPLFLHRPLATMGEASYSVYLLHPLVYSVFGYFILRLTVLETDIERLIVILLSVCMTFLVSYFVYEKVEKYFMKKGKDLIKGLRVRKTSAILD